MMKPPTAIRAAATIARLLLLVCSALLVDWWSCENGPRTFSAVAGAAETDQAADPPQTASAQPLHQRIDRAVEQAAVGPLAPLCNDADFIRRIYLDVTGAIPTADQVKSFLNDDSSDKRARLIDSLLDSPEFSRHIATQLDVLLMERRSDAHVDQKVWEAYLIDSVARNKPLDQIFRELVYPSGPGDDVTPARKFLLNRDAEPHAMTRDVGRMLFGMDLQCAQCHDHPLIDDYYQADYYGLHAFLNRTSLFKNGNDKVVKLSESAEGEASFESVFTGDGQEVTRPRLPKGATLYVEPQFDAEEAYLVKPEKTQAAKPAFSRRESLARMLTDSRPFRRNLANRVWAMIMGQGLVHPSDFHYFDNPPVNPALLALLADEMAEKGFDLKYAIRELTLSKTYQRSCELPRPETLNATDIAARLDRLTRQREATAADMKPLLAEVSKTRKAWTAAVDTNRQVDSELPALRERLTESREAVEQAETMHAAAKQTHQELVGRMQPFEKVLAATRAAEEQFDDEPALTESLAILEKRNGELTAAIDAAASELEQKTAALDAARMNVEHMETELASLEDRRVEPDELTRLERASLAAEAGLGDAHAARRLCDTQIELCEAILEFRTLRANDSVKADAAWESVVHRWTLQGQVAPLKPLTPEQLALSTMRASGVLERTESAAEKQIDKEPPEALTAEGVPEPEKARLRNIALQAEMLNQLRGSIKQFVTQFGGLDGEEFQATVNQALFFGNSPTVNGWLNPGTDTLVGRLKEIEEPGDVADELTLAVLSRSATSDEKREIADFLASASSEDEKDRTSALAELAWAMITSNEFRFNH